MYYQIEPPHHHTNSPSRSPKADHSPYSSVLSIKQGWTNLFPLGNQCETNVGVQFQNQFAQVLQQGALFTTHYLSLCYLRSKISTLINSKLVAALLIQKYINFIYRMSEYRSRPLGNRVPRLWLPRRISRFSWDTETPHFPILTVTNPPVGRG